MCSISLSYTSVLAVWTLSCVRHIYWCWSRVFSFFFFQAEDGIRDLVRSRGLGDVYKRQDQALALYPHFAAPFRPATSFAPITSCVTVLRVTICLLYTSDAADERSSVDLGGRRIIKKKKNYNTRSRTTKHYNSTEKLD